LDEQGERSFTFYRNPSADMLFRADEFEDDWFCNKGLFHVCSNTLTEAAIQKATLAGIKKAKQSDYLISFDINLRTNLWPQNANPLPAIWQVIGLTDVLKLSQEEMTFLCQTQSQDEVLSRAFDRGVSLILLTDGDKPLRYFTANRSASIEPPQVTMVDSTAAGDAFIGGFLYQMAAQNVSHARLPEFLNDTPSLERSLRFATRCGAFAVSHKGAFTSLPALADVAA
ncbi:MAG: PfkB family carbohydrate kinase, partial [Pontibacterium sp.]